MKMPILKLTNKATNKNNKVTSLALIFKKHHKLDFLQKNDIKTEN